MTQAKQKLLSFLVVFSFILSIFAVSPVFAVADLSSQEGFGSGGSQSVSQVFVGGSSSPKDVRVTIARIIRSLLGFLGIIFVILFLYAGFLWMTAGGNEAKVEESKKYISRSIIGLIIILASYSITGLALCKITDAAGGSAFSCMF
ncbi:MAG: hypothetical protein PF572_00245 [Patescibacteria group bacterium]|jgi:ACR3 family arsenite efflux pump ArsB|nr:hypothetical protein [Patescibacteria group bacterium]